MVQFQLKNNMKYISQKKGFTLVEMIVSLAVFMVVAVIAVGALLKITDANRKSQALKTAINNINYALDAMSREIRTGRNMVLYTVDGQNNYTLKDGEINGYGATGNNIGLNDEWIVVFESTKNSNHATNPCKLKIAYKFRSYANYNGSVTEKTIQKAEQPPTDLDCDGQLGDTLGSGPEYAFVDILSPEVQITNSIVDVDTSGGHGKASFWFKGYTGLRAKDRTDFEIQTTVSQRN